MRRTTCVPVGCSLPVAHGFTPAGFGWPGSFSHYFGRSSAALRAYSAAVARMTTAAMTGKQTSTLKTMVADEVAEDFARFTRERGYASQSDCLRELLLTAMYGPDHIADLHRQRIASLFGHRPAIGTADA